MAGHQDNPHANTDEEANPDADTYGHSNAHLLPADRPKDHRDPHAYEKAYPDTDPHQDPEAYTDP